MGSYLKKNKLLAGLVGVIGLGLLVAVVIIVLSPTQGPTFVTYAAPQIGVAVDKTMTVVDVLPGSPAEKAGIARGDMLKKVGGADFTLGSDPTGAIRNQIIARITPKAVSNEIGNLEVGELQVIINRGDQNLTLTLKPASPPFISPTGNQILPTALPASSDWIYL